LIHEVRRMSWIAKKKVNSLHASYEFAKLEGENEEDQESDYIEVSRTHTTRNLIAFFICGLINNFAYVVLLSAAKDILLEVAEQSETLPISSILLADVLPTLLVKLTAPWYMHRIPYRFRVVAVIILSTAGFHVVAWSPYIWLKFIGVVMASVSAGLGEITFLALASHFHKNTISTWSSGTGGAGVFGAFSYLAFTSWSHYDSKLALLISSIFPIFIGFSYFFLLTQPLIPLDQVTKDQTDDESHYSLAEDDLVDSPYDVSLLERIKYIRVLLPFMVPLFVVFFTEYLINQGISPLIVFSNSPFTHRDHYVYYQFLYQGGVFLSRSSVNIFPIKKLWILPILQGVNLLLILAQVAFKFLPSVWFVFVIMFYEGLLGGATYCNAFYQIRNSSKIATKWKEFSLGVTSVSDSIGITLAAVVGIFVEPALRKL